jgi:hypothetical protein
MAVVLAAILHDPENRQFDLARECWQALASHFEHIYISASPQVDLKFLAFLRQNGAVIEQTERGVGEARRRALRLALGTDANHIQYCDFDRALHWVRSFPDELPIVAEEATVSDFVILGRTEHAFASHPTVQQVTEGLTNDAFSLAFGEIADVTAGSCAMTRQAAEILVEHSVSEINDTDTEWPLLILEHSLKVSQLECNGLEFETADYFQKEIAEAGSLEAWIKQVYDTSESWQQRTKMAKESVNRVIASVKKSGKLL